LGVIEKKKVLVLSSLSHERGNKARGDEGGYWGERGRRKQGTPYSDSWGKENVKEGAVRPEDH